MDWIRIQWGIQIRIAKPDLDPGGQNYSKKSKNINSFQCQGPDSMGYLDPFFILPLIQIHTYRYRYLVLYA
jgi:hypothetical protein